MMKSELKILVTGASGYIGSKLVKYLLKEKYQIAVLLRESSDSKLLETVLDEIKVYRVSMSFESINKVVSSFNPDVTIHLASLFLGDHKSIEISSLVESNILFGNLLVESISQNKLNYFINIGTAWQHFNSDQYSPVNLYAATKQAFEDILKYYVEVRLIKVLNIKLFDTYGNDDPRNKIFNLLKRISISGEKFEMSAGEQEVDIVHIDDVVKSLEIAISVIRSDSKFGKEIAIATGNPIPLKKWVELFEKQKDLNLQIEWGAKPYKNREIFKTWKNFEVLYEIKPRITFFD